MTLHMLFLRQNSENVEELWYVAPSEPSWANGLHVHWCQKLVDSMQHRCETVGYTTKF